MTGLRRVVVTGVGMVSPLGAGVDNVWKRLLNAESGIGTIQGFDASHLPSTIGGEVPIVGGVRSDDPFALDPEAVMPDKERRRVDPITIYALADYTAEPAVRFLMDAAKRRKWPPKAEEDLSRLVEEHFLKTDPEALAAWSDVNAPSDAATVKVALKYVEQWRLVAWTRNLNYDSGVAPSTESVLLRLEAARAQLPEELRPAGQGTSADAKARMWAYRWRRRWGARFMKIRARDDVPLKEMQEKAPHFYPPMAPEMVSKVCPFSGRVFRTANTKTSKTGQKTSPFSGHAFVLVFGFTGVAFPSGIGCLALVEFLR